MNDKREYAEIMKKLREIPEIAYELDLIHRYVCELRKPHVQVQTVEVRDEAKLTELERQLHELTAKHKELEQKYAFEKGKTKLPSAPIVASRDAVFEYIKDAARTVIAGIQIPLSQAEHYQIIHALLVIAVNKSIDQLSYKVLKGTIGDHFSREQIAKICEEMHGAMTKCLHSHLDTALLSLKQAEGILTRPHRPVHPAVHDSVDQAAPTERGTTLGLAEFWATTNLEQPRARNDMHRHFRRVVADNVEAKLLVAPELTFSKKGYFVRWTGRDLTVVELSAAQRRNFGLGQGVIAQHFEPISDTPEPSASILATLTDVRIDQVNGLDPEQPLSGKCTIEFDHSVRIPVGPCAFRARYFHPEVPLRITSYSYIDFPLMADGDLRFSFPPVHSENNPIAWKSVVLFLQLIQRDGHETERNFPCLSNVATAIVDFRLENETDT